MTITVTSIIVLVKTIIIIQQFTLSPSLHQHRDCVTSFTAAHVTCEYRVTSGEVTGCLPLHTDGKCKRRLFSLETLFFSASDFTDSWCPWVWWATNQLNVYFTPAPSGLPPHTHVHREPEWMSIQCLLWSVLWYISPTREMYSAAPRATCSRRFPEGLLWSRGGN